MLLSPVVVVVVLVLVLVVVVGAHPLGLTSPPSSAVLVLVLNISNFNWDRG